MEKIEELTEERIEELVQMIMRQTEYTANEATEKLEECDYDHIKVIKNYLGIVDKKEPKIKSVNQEIYRQLRAKLNALPPLEKVVPNTTFGKGCAKPDCL